MISYPSMNGIKAMNDMVIVYFSATGNTLMVSKKLSQLFSKAYNVSLVNIEDKEAIERLDLKDKILGIGFPCYAFEYPKHVFEPLFKRLEMMDDSIKTFIFSTYCISPGISSKKMIRKLESLNCFVLSSGGFICPSAGFVSISDGKEKGFKKIVMKKTTKFEPSLEHKIKAYYEKVKRDLKTDKRINFIIMPYEYLPVLFARWNEKRIFTDYKIDPDKCIGCGKCVENCPVSNIKRGDEITFVNAKDCLRCQRCISHCPENAITLGEMTREKRRYTNELRVNLVSKT